MRKYKRNLEKINLTEEIENSFEDLMDNLDLQLRCCHSEMSIFSYWHEGENITKTVQEGFFKDWQDIKFVLDGYHPVKHKCSCFSKFIFMQKRYPSFAQFMWRF